MGGAGMGQGGMNDEWTVSLLGRTGWREAFFNIIFYIELWVRTGCGYAVPDPSKGGKIDRAETGSRPNDLFMQ